MEEAIKLLETEIVDRQNRVEGLLAQADMHLAEARDIQNAIKTLRKFHISKGAFEATQQMVTQVNGTAVQSQEKVVSAPETPAEAETPPTVVATGQEMAPKPVSQKPHHETQKELRDRLVANGTIKPKPRPSHDEPVERGQSIDLRKGKWSEEKKAAAAAKRQGIKPLNGKCPLAIKGNVLLLNGIYLDELDQDERFIMVDLIRDFGFEVLRSMMRGTVKDIDKVVTKLRTVIPRTLEIKDTATGWKLQNKEV